MLALLFARRGAEAQSLAGDVEVERLSAIAANGVLHTLAASLFDEDDDAASATGSADFGGASAMLAGYGDELIDQRRRDTRGVAATQLPLFAQKTLDVVP